jgi:natural product biosynthesis luciferase-like monooxygenase protein
MDDLSKRMAALSPEQRALLELRMKKRGLQPDAAQSPAAGLPAALLDDAWMPDHRENKNAERGMRFSLFFFSDEGSTTAEDKYRLVIECARFADEHGFAAVWTPERHFQDFGGLYPNPAVLASALAMITRHIQLRAGSVALPLHHPIRVAEDWSVVDNLSRGRVSVSFASGWHPGDFVLAPQNYERRKQVMYESIQTIRALWAGESVTVPGVDGGDVAVRMLPQPIQRELPIWITSAGNNETWMKAGEIGANVLTSLPPVVHAFEDLAEKIASYREALARHGHDPAGGQVAVMLHTFLGTELEAVKQQVRAPLCDYLRTYLDQFGKLTTPEMRAQREQGTQEDADTLIAFVFERYFRTSSLLGTPDSCAPVVDRLQAIGVDEIACLMDFGLAADAVIESLPHLSALKAHYERQPVA